MNRSSARTGNEHQLLIQTLTPATRAPLLSLARRIADAGCSLADARVSTIGDDTSLTLLAAGPWDAVAKLETALTKFGRDPELHLQHYRTTPREQTAHLLPYLVEVVAADRPGILVKLMEFFNRHEVRVEQLNSMRYQAMQTGAEMFQAQISLGIPAELHLATLRDDFFELCDGLNLDAVMDPVKF
ncbi:glycine cleavage system protein R [Frateuria defendens]|uniref:glycine cleavage system protein R n=1 Tax=Frateuria defendens TaxID=2219559 RepID=UPI000A728735|nr:ACT domain-containing protein [Frateuria defendens]